jgi:hypothetical protein
MARLPSGFLGGFANSEEGLRNDAVEKLPNAKLAIFREDTATN